MAFRGEAVDQNIEHALGRSRCYSLRFKPVLIAELKDTVLLEISWDGKFSMGTCRVAAFVGLAKRFASAGKPDVWSRKKTNIARSDGFTAGIKNPVFAFV